MNARRYQYEFKDSQQYYKLFFAEFIPNEFLNAQKIHSPEKHLIMILLHYRS